MTLILDTIWAGIASRINLKKVLTDSIPHIQKDGPTLPKKPAPKVTKDDKIPIEWIHLNILVAVFFIVILLINPTLNLSISLLLTILLLFRTVLDYLIGWNAIYIRRIWDIQNGDDARSDDDGDWT